MSKIKILFFKAAEENGEDQPGTEEYKETDSESDDEDDEETKWRPTYRTNVIPPKNNFLDPKIQKIIAKEATRGYQPLERETLHYKWIEYNGNECWGYGGLNWH